MGSVEAVQSEEITRSDREEVADASSTVPYEPPMLVRVGSLRTLLGKSGFIPDKTPPFELRE
ncbi:lasso RiPP family leader peptide-containing protein [Myxococcota bacterium]|nr:lasso RiPP family leader peptide-containing protein [Myxococcota bacterium]